MSHTLLSETNIRNKIVFLPLTEWEHDQNFFVVVLTYRIECSYEKLLTKNGTCMVFRKVKMNFVLNFLYLGSKLT